MRFWVAEIGGDAQSPQAPPSQYRDSHQANGTIAPLGNRRERTLEILVPSPAPDPDPRHSPWEEMSGAAVWCKGCIIGVVSKHHPGDGLGSLAAARIERLYSTLDIQALASAGELAGLPVQREQLVDVSDPAYAGAMECPYLGLQPFTPEALAPPVRHTPPAPLMGPRWSPWPRLLFRDPRQ